MVIYTRIQKVTSGDDEYLLTEAGDGIITEGGDLIALESSGGIDTIFNDAINIDVTKDSSDNNSSSSFITKFENTAGYHKDDFSINDEIIIRADKDINPPTTRIFRGLIEDIKFSGQGSTKEELTISGRDFTARLQDYKVEPIVYNDTEVSVIVKDIMSPITDITTNNVETTNTTIDNISFNHQSVFDALRQLADLSGRFFYIDVDNDLNFKQKSSTSSGVVLNNTNIIKSDFRELDRDIANNVWVYGDTVFVGAQNTFTADGGSIYTLDFKPYNTNTFVAGSTTPKQGDIFGAVLGDVGSPTQYLVDFDGARIIFVSGTEAGDNIPTSGSDSIQVDYERKRQIIKFGLDRNSETAYGRKDKVILDKNIITPSAAAARVTQELNNNASPFIEGTVTLNNAINLIPGTFLTVNLPNANQNNVNYDILQTKYQFTTKNNLSENVITVKLNRRVLELTDTIKDLLLEVKDIQAQSFFNTDELTRLEFATGSFGLRVSEWNVQTRTIGDSFVLGHPVNGILGSPVIGTSGGQVVLGSATAGAFSKVRSGTHLDL